MFGMSGGFELLIIAGIVLLLFGSRLPGAMRNLGSSIVEFKKGIKDSSDESGEEDEASRKEGTSAS